MSDVGAVVKVTDCSPCGRGSIPGKASSFLKISTSNGLSLHFMCSNQHIDCWMLRWFHFNSGLLLDYNVEQNAQTHVLVKRWITFYVCSIAPCV